MITLQIIGVRRACQGMYLLIVVVLDVDVWIRQMGGGGDNWDWEDYFQDANAIIKPQFDCTKSSA